VELSGGIALKKLNEDSIIGEYRTILICGGDAELSVTAT
jgi:hypothetical protein